MKTYFIRHSSELDVEQAMLDGMWEQQLVGIHYPQDRHGKLLGKDNASLDPVDYAKGVQGNIKRLNALTEEGGYVYSRYRGIPGAKLGVVHPGSQVQLLKGRWGKQNGLEGREAVIKAIRLDRVINLSATDSLPLSTVQPRQGTICQWHKINKRVKAILEGEASGGVGSLSPDLQEVMCMEFLRTSAAAEAGLPMLQSTLAPIGRTMPDVDIYGLSTTGWPVVAQVTYHTLERSISEGKLGKLDAYARDRAKTLMFCRCEHPTRIGDHLAYPLRDVYRAYCEETPEGKAWLAAVSG